MYPETPQDHSTSPASLPAVPLPPQGTPVEQPGRAPEPIQPVNPPTPGSVANANDTQIVVQAKQLVAQYQNDPFRLSGTLQQLKGNYLAEHFNITPNSVEG